MVILAQRSNTPPQKTLDLSFNFILLLGPWPLYYGGTALAVLKCRAQVDVSSTGSCRTSLRVGCEDRIFGKAGRTRMIVRVRFLERFGRARLLPSRISAARQEPRPPEENRAHFTRRCARDSS